MNRCRTLALGLLLGCPSTTPATPVPPQVEAAAEPAPEPAPEPAAIEPCESATRVADFAPAVHGLAVDAEGTLWWSDSYPGKGKTSRVYRRRAGSSTDEPTEITGATLAGLRFDDGHLVVCDVASPNVRSFAPDGSIDRNWTVPGSWNTARLTDGRMVAVTHGGQVWSMTDDETVTTLFDGLDAPFGIAAGPDATMWITEQGQAEGQVTRRDASGKVVETIEGAWDNPEGIAVTEAGLVVADTAAGAVFDVRLDGVPRLAVEVELPITATDFGEHVIVSTAGASPGLWQIRACP